ncbi:N-acetyltransferase domain-containing protein [Plasmodiophora brassicae]|uniref:N-acetyltransferase domain-containing protein n=1 Tax=Plasmodiophora brassicae TaxID=37360 RepID=A0A0G4IHU8_PLABS|nr:hypothetical protein PBRA_000432 [Plasmodiophora brassicae]SPQ93090.1 unnamed protein product [Plasmodiophora brassicae]
MLSTLLALIAGVACVQSAIVFTVADVGRCRTLVERFYRDPGLNSISGNRYLPDPEYSPGGQYIIAQSELSHAGEFNFVACDRMGDNVTFVGEFTIKRNKELENDTANPYAAWYIFENFGIVPSMRRRGIARAALLPMIRHFHANQPDGVPASKAVAFALTDNWGAFELYLHSGFLRNVVLLKGREEHIFSNARLARLDALQTIGSASNCTGPHKFRGASFARFVDDPEAEATAHANTEVIKAACSWLRTNGH